MKKFTPYKNIRKQAVILGLPMSFFALQMISVIGSLLGIIFSFSLRVIVMVLLWNFGLYVFMTKISKDPALFHLQGVFPKTITNKKQSRLYYEDD